MRLFTFIVHIKPWRSVDPMRKSLGGNAVETPIRGELPRATYCPQCLQYHSTYIHQVHFSVSIEIVSGLLDLFFLRGVEPFSFHLQDFRNGRKTCLGRTCAKEAHGDNHYGAWAGR